jgi:hypothetical protein
VINHGNQLQILFEGEEELYKDIPTKRSYREFDSLYQIEGIEFDDFIFQAYVKDKGVENNPICVKDLVCKGMDCNKPLCRIVF